jgi:hypothetical protein
LEHMAESLQYRGKFWDQVHKKSPLKRSEVKQLNLDRCG